MSGHKNFLSERSRAICPGAREIRNRVTEKTDVLIRKWQEIEDAMKILSCDINQVSSEHTSQLQIKLQTVIDRFLSMEGGLQNQCRSIASAASTKPSNCPYRSDDVDRNESTKTMMPVLVWAEFLRALTLEAGSMQRYGSTLSIALLRFQVADNNSTLEGGNTRELELTRFMTLLLAAMRSCDIIGCLSEDYFVVLFPHTSAAEATIALHRLEKIGNCETDDMTRESSSISGIKYSFTLEQYRPEETPVNAIKRLISESRSDRE